MTKEENEHPLFEVIKNSKPETIIEDVRNFFEIDGVSIEILDGSGMTPLMHACWKGNVSFAKFLIDQVNIKKLLTLLFKFLGFEEKKRLSSLLVLQSLLLSKTALMKSDEKFKV